MAAPLILVACGSWGSLWAAVPVEEWAAQVAVASESPEAAARRHERVAARRTRIQVICHRGALEFAHENTLEAYRATFELGADGNEIDIRATKDGVIVCFHDDMLDHILEAYGDTRDYTWNALRRFRFRRPGTFGEHCRIPTLVEALELHRRQAGLLHLDSKRPGMDRAISLLLDRMDMWDHVIAANDKNGGVILTDERFVPVRFKAGLYSDHSEVLPQPIAAALEKPGEAVMVEDPRGVLFKLGRSWGRPSREPVSPLPSPIPVPPPHDSILESLIEILASADDWNQPQFTEAGQAQQAERILQRARAADALAAKGQFTPELADLLEQRIRHRSLHVDWRYHALDGAAALRALFTLRSDRALPLARFCLMRDDPEVSQVRNSQWDTPRAWVRASRFSNVRVVCRMS